MAAINTAINDGRRRGVKRQKKSIPRIDMTPMVDLGFLLICFFVITTELMKPVVVKLNMPKEGGPPSKLGDSNALTVLLSGNDKIWFYEGNWKEALVNNRIAASGIVSIQELRNTIIEKKKRLDISGSKEGSAGLMLLVKADENANYRNVIDLLDEVMINDIKKYAIVKMEPHEIDWISKRP